MFVIALNISLCCTRLQTTQEQEESLGTPNKNNNDYDDDNNNNNYNKQQLCFNGFFSLYIHVKLVLVAIYVFCVAL